MPISNVSAIIDHVHVLRDNGEDDAIWSGNYLLAQNMLSPMTAGEDSQTTTV